MAIPKLYRERTNLWTVLAQIVVFLLGILCLFLAAKWQWLASYPGIQTVVRDFGGMLVATVTITILWQLVVRRAFLAELMAMAKLAEEVRAAGLVTLTNDFQRGIDWPQLFRTVNKLDIFFAYGRTWRGTNSAELRALAGRPGVRVRVVLPDPNDDALMSELARRFSMTPSDVKKEVEEASGDFKKTFVEFSQSVAQFTLWYLPASPVFSFYRFDHLAILALYKHSPGRGEVPTFVVEQGGTLYDFVRQEFEAFIREPNGLARRVLSAVQ